MTARLVVDEACPHCGAALRLEVQAEVAAVPRPPERVEMPPGLFDATADDLAAVERGVCPADWMVPDIVTNGTSNGGGVFERDTFDAPLDTGEPAPKAPLPPWVPVPGLDEQRFGSPPGEGEAPVAPVRAGDVRLHEGHEVDVLDLRYPEGAVVADVLRLHEGEPVEADCLVVPVAELRTAPLVRSNWVSRFYPRAFPQDGDLRRLGNLDVYVWRREKGWLLLPRSPLRLHGLDYCAASIERNGRWSTREVIAQTTLLHRGASTTHPDTVPSRILHPGEDTLTDALLLLAAEEPDWSRESFQRCLLQVLDLRNRMPGPPPLKALAESLVEMWGDQARRVAYSTSPVNVAQLAREHACGGGWGLLEELRLLADARGA